MTPEEKWQEQRRNTPEGAPLPPPPQPVLAHWACASLKVTTMPRVKRLAEKAYRAEYNEPLRNEHLNALKAELRGALRLVEGILEEAL